VSIARFVCLMLVTGLCFASNHEAESPVARILIGGDLDFPMPAAAHVGDGIHPTDQAHRYILQRCMDAFYRSWLTDSIIQPGEDSDARFPDKSLSRSLWILEEWGAGILLLVFGIVAIIKRQRRLTRQD